MSTNRRSHVVFFLFSTLEATARDKIRKHFLAPHQFKRVMPPQRTESPVTYSPIPHLLSCLPLSEEANGADVRCILKEVAWQTTLLQLKRMQKKSFGSQGGGGQVSAAFCFGWGLCALKNLTNVSVHISEYLRRSSLEAFVLLLSEESIKSEKPACKWSRNVKYSCSFLARGHLLSFLSWCISDQAYCSQNPC